MIYFLNLITLLIVQTAAVKGSRCIDTYYSAKGGCVKCPLLCTACQSETNCTQCIDGVYGINCTTPCPEYCSPHKCHPQHGYCVHDCLDGHFPLKNNKGCAPCQKNCRICGSLLHCYICRHGFYGPTCAQVCRLADCVGKECSPLIGQCQECADGFYLQDGSCVLCPHECTRCANATLCTECQKTHVGPFEGQCIRKCSFANTTKFVANSSQRCEVSLYNINKNESSCLNVRSERRYTCTTLRYCIDCGAFGDECPNRTATEVVCAGFEWCRNECKQPPRDQVLHNDNSISKYMVCELQCSGNKPFGIHVAPTQLYNYFYRVDPNTLIVAETPYGNRSESVPYVKTGHELPLLCFPREHDNMTKDEKEPVDVRCFQLNQQTEYISVDTTIDESYSRAVAIFTIFAMVLAAVLAVAACWLTHRALQDSNVRSVDSFSRGIEEGIV